MRLRTTKLGIKVATGILAAVQFFAPAMTVYAATNDSSTSIASRVAAKNTVETQSETTSENHIPAPKMDENLKVQVLKNDKVTATRISEADGNKIENFGAFWRTKRGRKAGHHTFVWRDNGSQVISYVMNYALSGKEPYEPGKINIHVSKTVLNDRFGNSIGRVTFGVPQAPDRNAMFAYTETDTEYIISNTKKLPAASSGFIEASIRDIVPSEVKDVATGYKTAPIQPTIEVVTNKGTILSSESSPLTASFNTTGEIYGGYLRHDSDIRGEFPRYWDDSLRPSNSDDYYYVTFTTYAFNRANQYFNVNLNVDARKSNDARGAIVLGVRNHRTGQIFKGNGSGQLDVPFESNVYQSDGQNFMATIYVAYPKRDFPANHNYSMVLSDKYVMEIVDDHTVTSTDAQVTVPFSPVRLDVPHGSFYVEKQGDGKDVDWVDEYHREGVYDTALNKLMSGQNVDLKYWVETRSRAGQYTLRDGGDPKNLHDYGQKEFQMITTDDNLYFGETKLNSDDAEFKSLDFQYMLQGFDLTYLSDSHRVSNPLTGTDFCINGDTTKPIFGYKNAPNYRLPVVEIFAKCEGDYSYEKVGSIDYRSGKPVLTAFNGTRANGTVLSFKPNTVGYQLKTSMSLSGYAQDVDVTVTVKPSDRIKDAIRELYKNTILPRGYLSNKARLDIVDDGHKGFIDEYIGRNQIMGFADGVKPEKKLVKYDNDIKHMNANLTYELSNTVQTNLLSKKSIKQAIDDKWFKESIQGTFYDLVPKGMIPVASSIKAVNADDSIENIKIIENYQNTGRSMLIVKLRHKPNYKYHYRADDSVLGAKGYYDKSAVRYMARYSWLNLKTYGDLVANIMAFDSNVHSGTVQGLKSESDINSDQNQFTHLAFRTNEEKTAFQDLKGNLTFARTDDHLIIDTASRTSLLKQVDVNNEGLFNDGLDEYIAKNVYPNGRYEYAISVQMPDNAKNKDMIFYDSLENFKPQDENKDDATWRGKLESINLDSLIGLGVNPVVYYSTKKGLILDDENNRSDSDLTNTSVWTKTKPKAEDITAVAVDARKMNDGSPFVLDAGMSVNFKLLMRAPKHVSNDMLDTVLTKDQKEAGMTGGAHAYNNAVLTSRQISLKTGVVGPNLLIHNDYTKVGLKPFKVGVEKTWNDDDDRDGLRNSSVEVELYANDKPTGKKATLSDENHWKGDFGQVPYLDDRGVMIVYTVKEKDIKGYHMVIKDQKINDDGLTFKISNEHDPEKIDINGEKIWTDNNYLKRPESIGVILKADGKTIRELDVRPVNGKWLYDFGQLFKYRDKGVKIRYELFEKDYVTGYVTKIEGFNVHNIYDPFTTVTIQKQVSNGTAASQKLNPDFTFRLNVMDLKRQLVNETYDYTTSLGRSGKLSVGQDFTLKDKEVMTLIHVPSERVLNVTETKLPDGYKLYGIDGNNVTLQAGKPVTIIAKNHYEAEGQIKIYMDKSLTGRALKPYEFKFELLEDGKNNFVTAAATNDANGGIDFYMPYSNKDSGTIRHYVVREVDGALGGVTYDKKTYPITVHISDDGKGKIIGTVEGDKQTFKNDYHAKGTVELKAWKVMSDHSKPKDGAYSFELLQDGKVIKSVVNDKDGGISFPLDFTEKNVGKTYNYTVREVRGNDSDVIYDTHTVDYSVTVFDRGNGMLDFKTTAKDNYTDDEYNDANSPVFYNKVKDGSLTISKAVQKGDLVKTFKFKVKLKGQNVKNGNYHIMRKRNVIEPNLTVDKTDKKTEVSYNVSVFDKKSEVSDKKFESSVKTDKSKLNKSNKVIKLVKAVETNMSKKDLYNFKFDLKGWESVRTDVATSLEEHNGVCGSVKWSIDKNGTLLLEPVRGDRGSFYLDIEMRQGRNDYSFRTFRDRGIMEDYYSDAPWLPYRKSIKKIQTRGTIVAPRDSGGLFYGCGVKELDMENFDVSKTYCIDGMFGDCSELTSLSSLEGWNTKNVLAMNNMFSDCSKLISLVPLKKWNTEKVMLMYGMFCNCPNLTSLTGLEKWSTGNVMDMSYMFSGCSKLTSLSPLKKWNTEKVQGMNAMFNYCPRLVSVEFGNHFVTANNPDMDDIFNACFNLSRVRIPKLSKKSVKYIQQLPIYEQKNRTDKWIREDKAYGPYTPQEMYANWTPAMSGWWIREQIPMNYTVQFDFQGSGQSEKAYVATKDEDIVLPKITVMPVGKTFRGWSLTKNGDIITSLQNLAEVGQTVTLYAIWDSLSDNVDINNGEFTVDVPAGESVTIDGLTAGTDYEVEEFHKDGWVKVQEMNSIGKILSNKDQRALFANHYDPQKKQVSVGLQAKKLLDGKLAGGFEFELLENGKVIDKATSQFDGTINFTPINYSEAGHHEYQVREKVGNDKSITYDTTVRTITVDVTEVDGKLQAQTTKAPVFNNTTKTGSLDITKAIDNRNDVTTSFNFVLTIGDKDEAFSLKVGEHKVINNLPIGTAYLLKEVNIPEGYSQVKIDNPVGAIKENEITKVTVTNTYHYSGFAQFKAHKVLEGGKLTSGQFTFRLSKDGQKVQDVQNDGNGDITFDAIEFNKPGTYHYTISEVGQVQGIKMDSHVIKADVTTTAQDDGTLKVDVKYDGDTTFKNKVVPDEPTIVPEHKVRTNIKITKKVVGVNTRRAFRLNVDSSMLENGVKYEVTSDKSSKKIYLSKDKAVLNIRDGETLTIHNVLMPQEPDKYISERNYNGYTCNIDVNSEPTANGNGLHYIVTNTYHVNDQFTLKGTKKLIGGNVNNYRFKFLILKDDDIVSTGYNDGENICFKSIYYTEKDLGKTYTYTVIEDTGTNSSITYDTSAKTVKVTIGSSDNGKMSIRASGDVETLWTQGGKIVLGYSVTFTNKLIPNLPVTGTIVTACILAGLTITLSLVCLVKRKH